MLAAGTAAQNGARVTLLEQNEKLGKKLYITGKGRCNVTNRCEREEFFANVMRNPKFLYGAYAQLDNEGLCRILEENGCPVKTERGRRVFPVSDKSSDVIKALAAFMEKAGVRVLLGKRVTRISFAGGKWEAASQEGVFTADRLILAMGGASYPSTGSRGEGFSFAENLGHTVLAPRPSLVPLYANQPWLARLSGLTLKNVVLKAEVKGKRVMEEMGEFLFAHFGYTGPLVLTLSARVTAEELPHLRARLDLKPALAPDVLEARLLREVAAAPNRQIKTVMAALAPASLGEVLLEMASVPAEMPAHQLSKKQRIKIAELLKGFPLQPQRLGSLEEAVITRGGVEVKEIQPKTMESKLMPGLYFAGEMVNCDALTGGYNLQIAFSTGCLAGVSAAGGQ